MVGSTTGGTARLSVVATSAVDIIYGYDVNANQVFAVTNAGSMFNGVLGQEQLLPSVVNRSFFGNYSPASVNRLTTTDYIMSNSTANATPTLLKIDGSTTTIPTTRAVYGAVAFIIDIAAVNSVGTLGWYHRLTGAIKIASNTGSIIDAVTEEILAEDSSASGWTAAVAVTNASGVPQLTVTVTGAASTTISWIAKVKLNVLGFGGLTP